MTESIFSIIKWHEETFPDTTGTEQVKKWHLECQEFEDSDYDYIELADMFIVACGLARFDINQAIPKFAVVWNNADDIVLFEECVQKKMAINRQRTWHKVNGEWRHK